MPNAPMSPVQEGVHRAPPPRYESDDRSRCLIT